MSDKKYECKQLLKLITGFARRWGRDESLRERGGTKKKDPVSYGTPGLTPCPYMKRVPVSAGSPAHGATVVRASLRERYTSKICRGVSGSSRGRSEKW